MTDAAQTILFVGATGSIGRLAVAEALRRGYRVRALVRDAARARRILPAEAELVSGDVTRPETLPDAVAGIDAMVLTLNTDGQGRAASEAVYYNALRDLLRAIGPRPVHVALMTTIGVTERNLAYNRSAEAHDWKRRAERLVRASGHSYCIIRPGWFDYADAGQRKIVMLQGDTPRSGTPADGGIARDQIARVLVDSISQPAAQGKTFELVAASGAEQVDLGPVFAALDPDRPGALDGVRDIDSQPLSQEPARVRRDLEMMPGFGPAATASGGQDT